MSAPDNLSKVERLRARDGGKCWLCDGPIDFKAEPNSARAPSIEHLIAQCHGGPNRIDNLVLCHPPCNRELADRPLVGKIKLRDEIQKRKWLKGLRRAILPHLTS